jgi:hypothetical protein
MEKKKEMPAPKGNKNAAKDSDPEQLNKWIKAYIIHRAEGFSKESFIECDYRTIEKYIESNIDLQSLKKELEKAERAGFKYWEQLGKDLSSGKVRGNPAVWIFTVKNKFPDQYKDKTETEHSGTISVERINYIPPDGSNNQTDT